MNSSLYRLHCYYFGQLIIFNIYSQSVTTHMKSILTIMKLKVKPLNWQKSPNKP